MNKCILIGNLTKDPELAETSSGISYTNLSIAVSRPFVNEDGERATDFFNVTVWRTQAENCTKYLAKGKKVSIVARLQNRTYEDKNGNKRVAYEIIADQVSFCGSKAESGTGNYDSVSPSSYNNSSADDFASVVGDDDDLPF